MTKYILSNGTSYHEDTKQYVIDICDIAIKTRQRVQIRYKKDYEDYTGYTKDGLNVSMYIGRSTGTIKIPLHIPSTRSYGGCGLSTNLIESIYIK